MNSIKAGVGLSNNSDSFKAGQEACQMAIDKAGSKPNLVIVFASIALNQEEMLKGVNSVAQDSVVVGCSDAGEITEEGPVKGQVAVMAINSDKIEFVAGVGRGVGADSHKAGKEAAEEVLKKAKGKISMFVMLPDGTAGNGAAIVRGVQEALGEHFPIMGGSAGDDFNFKKSYQYFQDQVLCDVVVGLGFVGDFHWGVGVRHGWEPLGIPMEVTKSEGAILKEIDGKPALKIYEDYFGKQAEELTKEPIARMAYTYPLGISVKGSSELLLRDAVIANEKGEITCAAEIPQGSEIRLMLGDQEKAIQAAQEAAQNALSQLKGAKPKIILVFNCVARYKLLGSRVGEEITAIQDILGRDVPLIGFYTYGEQAPLGGNIDPKTCHSAFHNETMALLVIGD